MNRVYGNTLRPVMEAEGLLANGFDDFTVHCTKTNPGLGFEQTEMRKGPLSLIPRNLRPDGVPFLFDMPLVLKEKFAPEVTAVHAQNYYSVLAVANGFKGKLILDYHSLKSSVLRDLHAGSLAHQYVIAPFVKRIERKGIARAEKIVVASANIKREMVKEHDVPQEKIEVVNNMLDPAAFPRNRYEAEFEVGVVGPFAHINCEAMNALRSIANRTSANFSLVGSISSADKALFNGMDNVKVLGRLGDKEYKDYMASIGALLLPYGRYHRGGGSRNKLLEAAACGTPIISTRSGAKGFDEKNALLMAETPQEMITCIEELKNDVGARKKMGKGLRTIIKRNYNYFAETKKLIEVYESVM